MDILSELLTTPLAEPPTHAEAWKAQWQTSTGPMGVRALMGGLRSDRPAWAFAWGYQSALHCMVPSLQGVGALAISEGRNTRPKSIATTAAKGRLKGRKSYAFLGEHADCILVLARAGEADGRPILKLYPVASIAEGVIHRPLGPTPFLPEVPHSALELDLPSPPPLKGDGWSDYSKPFRTLEDLFVMLAMLGHGVRICRLTGQDSELEAMLPLILALLSLSTQDPKLPALHRALEACLNQGLERLNAPPWATHAQETQQRWVRDRTLFALGSPARAVRIARARAHPSQRDDTLLLGPMDMLIP
jgi:hypothetical protein